MKVRGSLLKTTRDDIRTFAIAALLTGGMYLAATELGVLSSTFGLITGFAWMALSAAEHL